MKECKEPLLKVLLTFVFILLFVGAGFGINQNFFHTDYQPEIAGHYEEKVFVTNYGECYHSENCFYLQQSCYPIGKDKALERKYRACSYCNGVSQGYLYYPGKPSVAEKNDYVASFIISGLIFLTPIIWVIFYKKDSVDYVEKKE